MLGSRPLSHKQKLRPLVHNHRIVIERPQPFYCITSTRTNSPGSSMTALRALIKIDDGFLSAARPAVFHIFDLLFRVRGRQAASEDVRNRPKSTPIPYVSFHVRRISCLARFKPSYSPGKTAQSRTASLLSGGSALRDAVHSGRAKALKSRFRIRSSQV